MITTIDGTMFANMIKGGAANLYANRQAINDLNVFPIPDGDTGDNMYMTIDAAAGKADAGVGLGETARSAAHEMLLGARGNSGVILSRIFSGIAKGLGDCEKADTEAFVGALRSGVDEAYGAVAVPVEGTILTVYREAVEYAEKHCVGGSFESLFDGFIGELNRSLDRTPELLDVLAQAGVVDSGGAGFIYIAEGMYAALRGIDFDAGGEVGGAKRVDISAFTEDMELEFGYCTEFLLRLQNKKTDIENFDLQSFIDWLNSVGDSVVAFKEGSVLKVHVHTMRPGDILNHCQEYGEFLTTKIENMTLQHNETHQKPEKQLRRKVTKEYGIVAVAAGAGLQEIFRSLGCDVIVDGGQSMNPSAQAMLDAYEQAAAKTVFVFPNNSNILLTAQQAAAMTDADVRIIPTKTVGEGYAAISMFDPSEGGADVIEHSLNEIVSGVITGMVSVASRDTQRDGVEVKEGDFIGFVGDEILVDDPDRGKALYQLAKRLNAERYDIMLILAGEDPDPAECMRAQQTLASEYSRTEVIMLDGGQPVFDYIMILE